MVRAVETADLLVIGTPVYRASYTGALKHLFDLVRHDALAGKPVILTATGGSHLHGLVTEHQLRPLFGFFNALSLPTAVYATEADFRDYRIVNPAINDRIERAVTEAVGLFRTRTPLRITPTSTPRACRRRSTPETVSSENRDDLVQEARPKEAVARGPSRSSSPTGCPTSPAAW